jgi:hypothetical protein
MMRQVHTEVNILRKNPGPLLSRGLLWGLGWAGFRCAGRADVLLQLWRFFLGGFSTFLLLALPHSYTCT